MNEFEVCRTVKACNSVRNLWKYAWKSYLPCRHMAYVCWSELVIEQFVYELQ